MDVEGSARSDAVFLSYASQDAAAARRICEALRAAGVEVWFDQNELVGGDAWDAKIRKQIAECALFVPIISANTQARLEGYFRLEWKLAVDRTHLMAHDKAFLLPVVIDGTPDVAARVPPEFRAVQWTRLARSPSNSRTGDETSDKFCARVKTLLAGNKSEATSRAEENQPAMASGSKGPRVIRSLRLWLALGGIAVTAILAVTVRQTGMKSTPAPGTEAQRLVAKARAVFESGDLLKRETYSLTEALLRKAEELDVSEAEAWALHASVSRWMRDFGFDNSTDLAAALKTQAERAIKLAPASVEARLAYATVNDDEAESILRALLAERPNDWRVLHGLARLRRRQEKTDEAVHLLQQARRLSDDDQAITGDLVTVLVYAGRFAEAEAVVAEVLPRRSCGRILEFDVRLKLNWRGDAAAAATALARWPTWMLKEDRGAHCAAQVWMWNREPAKALAILGGFPRDYFRHNRFTGPRAALTAWLHEMAGNTQASRTDWRTVLQVTERELAATPANTPALHWKAWAMTRLGDRAAAESILRELLERKVGAFRANDTTGGLAGLALTVGNTDEAFAELERLFTGKQALQGFLSTRATLDLNPCFDGIRTDARFLAIRATAAAPGEKKENKASAPLTLASEKSLVVLPLENLSPDPRNAFFTDGMHVEIIAALQAVPELKVPSREAARALQRDGGSAIEMARRAGAGHVLTGSVRRESTSVRIQLDLRRVSDGELLWSAPRVTRELKDTLALQAEVAEEVARILRARFDKGAFAGLRFLATDPRAYDAYLRAHAQYQRNLNRPAAILQAVALMEEGMKLDPKFMPGARLLGRMYVRLYVIESAPRYADEAKRWSELSSGLTPGGSGDSALAAYFCSVENDYSRALFYAENATRALPNDAEGHCYAGLALRGLGRWKEALSRLERSFTLDPQNSPAWAPLLESLALLRRLDEFQSWLTKLRAANPDAASQAEFSAYRFSLDGIVPALPTRRNEIGTHALLAALWRMRSFEDLAATAALRTPSDGANENTFNRRLRQCDALRWLGRESEALAVAVELMDVVERMNALDLRDAAGRARRLAFAQSRLGRADEAATTMRRAMDASGEREALYRWKDEVELAQIYAYAGRARPCVEVLAKLITVPSGVTVPRLKADPAWDKVRDDPAFQALLNDPRNSAPL